jgi:hypothetical protein
VNRLPELRESLLDAARREHDRAGFADPSPPDPVAPGARSHRRSPHGRPTSLIAGAMMGLLVLAAAGFAATRLIQSGAPVTPRPGFSATPRAGFGVVEPGSAHLTAIATPDPNGGPAWGLRTLRTTRGLGCVEVGRRVGDEIGALGQDDAFADDGRFHPLPDTAITSGACELLDGAGHTFLAAASHGAAASGVVQDCQKTPTPAPAQLPAAARARLQKTPACPADDLRTLYYGLLGPQARSVTYRSDDGQLVTTPTVGPDGAYLVVRDDHPRQGPGTYFTVATSPASGLVSVQYRNGRRCVIPPPNRLGGATPCPLVGEVPLPAPPITSRQVATPVHASVVRSPTIGRVLDLSFVARLPVRDSRSHYAALIRLTPASGCAGRMLGGETSADTSAGRLVTLQIPIPRGCHGSATGNVTYVRTTGLATLPPPLGTGPLVGRVTARIP